MPDLFIALWWAGANGLAAWAEARFLRDAVPASAASADAPYVLAAALLSLPATAGLLPPALGLVLHMGLLALWGACVLRARWPALLLPAALLLTCASFREALCTVLFSCLSLMLPAPRLGLFLQITLTLLLAAAPLLLLRPLAAPCRAGYAPAPLLLLPCALLSCALRLGLGLDTNGAFRSALALWGGPEAALPRGLFWVLGAFTLLWVCAGAYRSISGLVPQAAQALRLGAEQTHAEELRAQSNRLAAFRHDLKNHMLVLNGLLKTRQLTAAERYLDSLCQLTAALSPTPGTGHPVIDVLLAQKRREAELQGVLLRLDLLLPDRLCLSDTDLCVLFSNALDNAIRAGADAPDGKRAVTLTLRPIRGFLLAEVVNGCASPRPFRPGTGLDNIRRTVCKYGGTLNTVQGPDSFRLTLMLPLAL